MQIKDLQKLGIGLLVGCGLLACGGEPPAPAVTEAAPPTNPGSTASANVQVFENEMTIEGTGRPRTIRLYLPPDYALSQKRYSVLYMHDGQNLFDDKTAYAGEWGVDEFFDARAKAGKSVPIVVGIDHGGERRNTEMVPWTPHGGANDESLAYVRFVVDQVKPWVDKHYRTWADPQHTAVMGSSLGGLISHFMINQYPDVFSKAGIFSPSYWVSEYAFKQIEHVSLPHDAKLYFVVGGQEDAKMVSNTLKVATLLQDNGFPISQFRVKVVQQGEHNEVFWGSEFEGAYQWLFGDPD
ncbi:alpha/beta hydrolase-fold protein [Aliiglaciecola sp. CAU 1673]|uniref:alpha/beta hydrolase n=1 Tax=Aliiglaciecola sp. CAU 1673 TaxID=3032595 RepID=UPI0023DC54DE|nr:alpha/beta hydrolase-fold protein [Aliiglaciecola sp. CAU 1673]MDF2179033.1 alpha/beta hydrolase-fold protein [Aliiglaciecola sp. CAU 1673]